MIAMTRRRIARARRRRRLIIAAGVLYGLAAAAVGAVLELLERDAQDLARRGPIA